MRKRQMIGWIIILLSVLILLFSILRDHHVYLGVFNGIYQFIDWFSFETFFDLVFESFESVFEFIDDYFWSLLFIILGIVLVFGARKQKKDEENFYFSSESSYYDRDREEKTERKKLRRNLDDMKLAGICSGLAHLLEVDPTIVRIMVLFIGLTTSGTVIFVYIILAFLLPGEHLG